MSSYYTDEFSALNSLVGALGSDTLSAGNSYELGKISLLQKLVSIFGLEAIATGQSIVRDGSGSFIPEDFALEEHLHDDATTSASGFQSATDKTKLDGIASAATQNSTDAQLRDRATHTGTQPLATITGLGTAAALNAADPNWNANKIQGKSVSDATFAEGSGETGLFYNFVSDLWEAKDLTFSSSAMSDADILAAILRVDENAAGINATTLQGIAPSGFASVSHAHPEATGSVAGFLGATDKTFLSSLQQSNVAAKRFFASPTNSDGQPSLRAIVKEDLPNTIAHLDTANTFTKAQRSQIQSITIDQSGAATINPDNSNNFSLELSQNASLTIQAGVPGDSFILFVTQTAIGGRVLNLPIGTLRQGGKPLIFSTSPGAIDQLFFNTHNGSTWCVSCSNFS